MIRINKDQLVSQQTANKFNKWPYFTICTAPSTVKSKNHRTGSNSIKSKIKYSGKPKAASYAPSHSNSRTRSNPKNRVKRPTIQNHKSIDREQIISRLGNGKFQKYQILNLGNQLKSKAPKKRKNSKKRPSKGRSTEMGF